jgi:hypothetical protein
VLHADPVFFSQAKFRQKKRVKIKILKKGDFGGFQSPEMRKF